MRAPGAGISAPRVCRLTKYAEPAGKITAGSATYSRAKCATCRTTTRCARTSLLGCAPRGGKGGMAACFSNGTGEAGDFALPIEHFPASSCGTAAFWNIRSQSNVTSLVWRFSQLYRDHMRSAFESVRRWQQLAEEAGSFARQMNDPEAIQIMRQIAQRYEILAEHAKKRALRDKPKSDPKLGRRAPGDRSKHELYLIRHWVFLPAITAPIAAFLRGLLSHGGNQWSAPTCGIGPRDNHSVPVRCRDRLSKCYVVFDDRLFSIAVRESDRTHSPYPARPGNGFGQDALNDGLKRNIKLAEP
jgi:hypothetical protein